MPVVSDGVVIVHLGSLVIYPHEKALQYK